jgi:hypothetical protein
VNAYLPTQTYEVYRYPLQQSRTYHKQQKIGGFREQHTDPRGGEAHGRNQERPLALLAKVNVDVGHVTASHLPNQKEQRPNEA